ncbi:MAG TPA: UDP-glucose/GDP-mannose dehydrogenase family protein [Patescibacteria group bacterium]|nr:UDP-glucose/GDP-mannose dehydrogenase family protein [Patescibacteria group bacterium]
MTITIIGHGYVGLVTAAVFADLGNTVWVIGRTKEKISRLQKGDPLIYEPGLEELLKRNLKAGRLKFTLNYKEAIPSSSIIFICVGTPSKQDGEADLSSVFSVAEKLGKYIKKYVVIACKSTVPVGTNRKIKNILITRGKVAPSMFDIASCPEFLREGTALSDTLHPDRVVIGTENKRAANVLTEFHKPITGERVHTNIETAEMIKYASNSLLATKISFANMIAFLAEKAGADAEFVLTGVGLDHRLGRSFLYPGAGYGGSCLPKDVKALIKVGERYGEELNLLKEVESINKQAMQRLGGKITDSLKQTRGKTVAILGLSFKPDTDDIREAPSRTIIKSLLDSGKAIRLRLYDPIVKKLADMPQKYVVYSDNSYSAVKGADVLVILTEWNEFRQLDLVKVKKLMRGTTVIDGRNIFDPEKVKRLGFTYIGVGRR